MGSHDPKPNPKEDGSKKGFDIRNTKPVEEASGGRHSTDDRTPKKDDDE